MQLFRTKTWSVLDIALLKWCCLLTGMIAGAYLADFTRHYAWVIAFAALLLAIRPAVRYFHND